MTIASTIRTSRVRNTPSFKHKQHGHVVPRSPSISLNGPGRLRTAHILALCGISHSTLYARQKAGTFPMPDGKDGGLNYWKTETIRKYLDA